MCCTISVLTSCLAAQGLPAFLRVLWQPISALYLLLAADKATALQTAGGSAACGVAT